MTENVFRDDPYAQSASATVRAVTQAGGLLCDRSVFYPTGGGQPGDSGVLRWTGGECRIEICINGEGDDVVLVPMEGETLPGVGTTVTQHLDWTRRYAHMRVHTALHLLSVAIPFGVTGGAISDGKGRLDFDMADPPDDKDAIARRLNEWIASDAPVSEEWITDEDLDAQPDLVKTLTVQPPRGSGRIRLIRIGTGSDTIDLQPCGGTHVASLAEIGQVRLGKVEKKGRMNRRVTLFLDA